MKPRPILNAILLAPLMLAPAFSQERTMTNRIMLLFFITFILLSDKLKNSIAQLLSESSQFNTNDVLVNVVEDNSKLFFIEEQRIFKIEDFPNIILNEAKKNKRESGVNTLCKAQGILKFEYKGSLVNAPIYLSPIDYSINKIKKELKFDEIDDESFLNPFIANYVADVDRNSKLNEDAIVHPCLLKGEPPPSSRTDLDIAEDKFVNC